MRHCLKQRCSFYIGKTKDLEYRGDRKERQRVSGVTAVGTLPSDFPLLFVMILIRCSEERKGKAFNSLNASGFGLLKAFEGWRVGTLRRLTCHMSHGTCLPMCVCVHVCECVYLSLCVCMYTCLFMSTGAQGGESCQIFPELPNMGSGNQTEVLCE